MKALSARLDPLMVFAAALAVRLVHVWQLRASPFFTVLMGDSRGYDDWAQRIAGGDWIGHDVFYQAPLYPYLLGIVYAAAGRHLLIVRVLQAVIGSASCALLALAAARLFRSRAIGVAAGLMLAFYAPAIFFDGLIQKSVLDVFFLCCALWLIAKLGSQGSQGAQGARRAHSERTPRTASTPRTSRTLALWFALGLTMGALALTRENALVFIVVILGWIVVQGLGARGLGLAAMRASVFLAGLAIVLVPVAIRNNAVGGGFYITTSQFGPNLYIGNNPRSDGTYQSLRFGRGAPEYERQDATELAEHALGRTLTPAEVSGYWTDKAIDFMTSRPGAWLTLMGRKVVLLWNRTEMLDTESQDAHAEWSLPLRLLGPLGTFGILVPLALLGVIVTWPMRRELWVVEAMAIAYAASVVVFYVFARYRYPLVPFLILFAAAGIVALPDAIRARRIPGGARTIAALAAVAVFTNVPTVSADMMRAVTESNLGVALQTEQRTNDAIAHYERAIALRPDYAPVYSNLATALRASGRVKDAVATYEHALTLQPDFPDAQYNLANALLEEGHPDAAVEHFQIALRSIPGSVDVDTNLGVALAEKGDANGAIDAFRRALAADPNSAKAHRNLGDLLASTGTTDQAIEHLKRAAQLEPGDEPTHYDLGSLLLELRRFDEAIAEFHAALAIAPKAVDVRNNLGIALASQGHIDQAIDQFQQALAIDATNEDARRNLAMARQARKP